jgi:AAA domain
MTFVTRVRSVTFSDGRELEVPETGVVVLVGPNNSGKSAALREIYRLLTGVPFQAHEPPLRVVRAVTFQKEGTEDELRDWLEESTTPSRNGRVANDSIRGAVIALAGIRRAVSGAPPSSAQASRRPAE